MPKPVVAVIAPNGQVAVELLSLLEETHRVVACDSLPDVHKSLESGEVVGAICDFTTPEEGGHSEDRFLDALQEQHPHVRIVMLTGADCPEPLERRAATTTMLHLRGTLDWQQVANFVCVGSECRDDVGSSECKATAEIANRRGEKSAAGDYGEQAAICDDVEAKAVLAGITRRFETKALRMKQMLAELEVAAKHDVTILLIGETGAGKTYLSRLIHEVSPRRDEPFLTVACGALTEDLIESELFGHVKGAFTGAHADKEGKFIAAGRGTLLLDEIDILSPEQQVKLLRVIETGEFEPVGSNKTLKSQARLVVASNLNLQPLVDQGKFRPDLYYRLNMLRFELLPLRERRQDITLLASTFIKQCAEKHNVTVERLDDSLFEALQTYPWPGNVRELENVIQRAVIYCRDGLLSSEHLPSHVREGTSGPTNDPSIRLPGGANEDEQSLERQIALTERQIIEQALFRNNFSRTNTAKDLGVSRVTLYNKMKKYGMPSK